MIHEYTYRNLLSFEIEAPENTLSNGRNFTNLESLFLYVSLINEIFIKNAIHIMKCNYMLKKEWVYREICEEVGNYHKNIHERI